MWQPYVDIAHTYFPNAKVIVDKYHFIRQVTWAIEGVRKRVQKTMPATLRKYYKRNHKRILTHYDKLKDENKQACDLMLLYHDELRKAHMLKEWFYRICQNEKYSIQRTEFYDWIKNAESCGIKEFEKYAATYRRWSKYILNAFKYGLTGFETEIYLSCPKTGEFSSNIKTALHPVIEHDSKNHTPILDIEPKFL